MNEKNERVGGFLKFLLLLAIVAIAILILWVTGLIRWESIPDEQVAQEPVVVVSKSDSDFAVLENEWRALQKEVRALRQEVEQLKANASQKTSAPRQQITVIQQTASQTLETTTQTVVNANDITLSKYSHDWVDSNANISLKNNTSKTVTYIEGRMYYYDMQENMLDYQDFTKTITIEPGLVKNFELKGYGYHENYAYYKSDISITHRDRKYTVKFELKSYKTK